MQSAIGLDCHVIECVEVGVLLNFLAALSHFFDELPNKRLSKPRFCQGAAL